MTWNSPRSKRSRRPVWLTAVALTIAMLLTPVASFADQWDDGGPGGGAHHTGVGGPGTPPTGSAKCGQNIGKLYGVLYGLFGGGWVPISDANHPNCAGPVQSGGTPPFAANGNFKLCPTGFEVYRFYGIKGKPKQTAITRSRVNLPAWCQGEERYTFTGQTAWDATPNQMPGLPDFRANAANLDQQRNGLNAQVGRRENGNLTSGKPILVKGTCRTISRENPLIDWYAGADAEAKVQLRMFFGQAFTSQFQGLKYPMTAAQELGLKTVSEGYWYNPDAQRAPGEDPVEKNKRQKGFKYYIKSFKFDTRECATPYNFTEIRDAETRKPVGGVPITGTCYIPVMRQAKQHSNGAGTAWSFSSLAYGYGERYSRFYGKNTGDDGVPDAWRVEMKNDFLNRSKAAKNGFFNNADMQVLPANHYPSETNSKRMNEKVDRSVKEAANDLAYWSRCRLGTHVTYYGGRRVTSDPGPTNATLELTSHNQKVLQAGGAPFQSRFTVSAGQLMCGGTPCGGRAVLSGLSYDMEIVGTNGYTECDAGQLSGCDFRIVSYQKGSSSRDGQMVVEFYHPTMDAQRVKYIVTNLHGSYSFIVGASEVEMTGYDPVTGEPYTVSAGTGTTTHTRNFTPTLEGAPMLQPGVGSGPFTIEYPVIGAIDVPLF